MLVRLELCGVVQGVGFRWFVRERARRHELAGWVRNRPDGCVELAASGQRESVDRFVAEVREGPPGAVVDVVRALSTEDLGDLDRPFTIRR